MRCDNCGKRVLFGNAVSHSKRHTRRRSEPNVHPATVVIQGETKKMNLCTRCIRTLHKAE